VTLQLATRAGQLLGLARLALFDVSRVLDRLLDLADLGADGVEAPLDLVELVAGVHVRGALLLERGLDAAHVGDRLLERIGLATGLLLELVQLFAERARVQREQLGMHLALLILEFLVALGRARLALGVLQLAVDLLAQVAQALEVLLGVADAVLGLAAPLLVLGDAGRLLEVDAQLLGLGLDQARDHALLDDRVAARPETCTQEDVGDVAATATRAVQRVGRDAVAAHLALDGDLGVLRILAAERTVAVVEGQLDRRDADRLARGRTVEDDTVRADDADQVAGDLDRGRVDERLEPGQLDLL
jgi:hypothetical protein